MRRFTLGLATFVIALGVFAVLAPPVSAQTCGDPANERMNDERATALDNIISANPGSSRDSFSCQNVSGASDTDVRANCVSGLCPGGANNRCCLPGIAASRPGAAGEGDAPAPTGPAAPQRLILPSCVESGKCDLDDIIQTGVNFANFLFGISGAVFLAIFVYAGILYLTAGGSTERIGKAKRMLVQATVGMLLVVGAGVMVTFIYNAFRGGAADRCESAHAGFQCTELPEGNLDEEVRNRGCVRGLCPGAANNVCCPSS